MKLSALGEFGLIDMISRMIDDAGLNARSGLVLGIGDDAAVWRTDASLQLCTTDTLVEKIDFIPGQVTWEELGWKLLAANLSDIAAMGGIPQYAVATLGLPPDTEAEDVRSLYRGMITLAARHKVAIAGGDVTRSPMVILGLTLLGKAPGDRYLSRSAARLTDLIAVTGYLGSSAAGLKMLSSGARLDDKTAEYLRQAHCRPQPRITEGQALLSQGVECAIDISDGLVSDLTHICKASRVGARVHTETLPVHPLLRKTFPSDALNMALAGGEDFELLFTAPRIIMNKLQLPGGALFTVIGEIVTENPGSVTLLDARGKALEQGVKGWDHFA